MKHLLDSSRVEEHEIHSIKEIWTRGVFPFLSQESIVQCLPLFLVSKGWYNMMCQVDTHTIVGNLKPVAYIFLSERIGNNTKSLVANNDMISVVCKYYPNLEILRFTGSYLGHDSISYEIHGLEKLKSLTLGRGVFVGGIDKLVGLQHFSALYLTSIGGAITLPKSIKRLYIGYDYRDPHSKGIRKISGLNLDYLESNIPPIFSVLEYTGIGKVLHREKYLSWSYEGEWLGGRYHGKGIFESPGFKCSGEWVNNIIKFGTVTRDFLDIWPDIGVKQIGFKSKAVYVGDLMDVGGHIYAHGNGKMTIGRQCYEGEFTNGYYNNDKTLVCIGSK